MNLIEKLGGYDEAKNCLEWMQKEGLLMGSYSTPNGIASFYDFALKSAILDHDRTNHISPNAKAIDK